MNRAAHKDTLALGGEPRVNLMPPAVIQQAADRLLRRKLLLATAATLVAVLLGIGGAWVHATNSGVRLAAAQTQTADLLTEQGKYVAVRQVQTQVTTLLAARSVGGWPEVDWKAYLQSVRAALPDDVGIDSVVVDSTSPVAAYEQPVTPLLNPRVATLTVTLYSPTLPSVAGWVQNLQGLPGMADATPGSITEQDGGGYTVVVTMHINSDAFTGRFADPTGSN